MTEKIINDGGPAFPTDMGGIKPKENVQEELADTCFQIADTMIAESKKGREECSK